MHFFFFSGLHKHTQEIHRHTHSTSFLQMFWKFFTFNFNLSYQDFCHFQHLFHKYLLSVQKELTLTTEQWGKRNKNHSPCGFLLLPVTIMVRTYYEGLGKGTKRWSQCEKLLEEQSRTCHPQMATAYLLTLSCLLCPIVSWSYLVF